MKDRITVIDMHTGGEPLRIVTGGYPPIPAGTILEKRAYVRDNLDHLRKMLMFEPRGHYDMYGALLVEPNLPGADLAVLFMHNEGYSTMCGHAIIALGRYAVDQGLVPAREPVTTVNIECPCGLVVASVEVKDGKAGAVSFESVPAFLVTTDLVKLPGYGGCVAFDLAYGGAFYAIADCRQFGLEFGKSRTRDFVDAATALTGLVKDFPLSHPDHDDLGFLYGSILTDGGDGSNGVATKNVCVFAEAEVDRSPTGSGVTARRPCMPRANWPSARRGISKASSVRVLRARWRGPPLPARMRQSSRASAAAPSIRARPSSSARKATNWAVVSWWCEAFVFDPGKSAPFRDRAQPARSTSRSAAGRASSRAETDLCRCTIMAAAKSGVRRLSSGTARKAATTSPAVNTVPAYLRRSALASASGLERMAANSKNSRPSR